MSIHTVEDLRRVYPHLVKEIEDKVLEHIGLEKKSVLAEGERRRIRKDAKKLAGL